MPGKKPIRADSWLWFHDELRRRLGIADYDALFAELARRRRAEQTAKQRKIAPREIAYYEEQRRIKAAMGKATKRIDASIAHWQAILDSPVENHDGEL